MEKVRFLLAPLIKSDANTLFGARAGQWAFRGSAIDRSAAGWISPPWPHWKLHCCVILRLLHIWIQLLALMAPEDVKKWLISPGSSFLHSRFFTIQPAKRGKDFATDLQWGKPEKWILCNRWFDMLEASSASLSVSPLVHTNAVRNAPVKWSFMVHNDQQVQHKFHDTCRGGKKNPTSNKKKKNKSLGKPGMSHGSVNTQAFSFSFVVLFNSQSDKSAGFNGNNKKYPGLTLHVDVNDTKGRTQAPQLGSSRLGIWHLHKAEGGRCLHLFFPSY